MPDAQTVRRIIDLRTRQHLSLRKIGALVGLSGERVRRVLAREGVLYKRVSQPPKKRKKQTVLDEAVVLALYGCSIEELAQIQGERLLTDHSSPAFLYRMQRYRWLRSSGWDFTLPTWWNVWEPHWRRRHPDSLVMVPHDRARPIGPTNAEIRTRSEVMRRFHQARKR